MENQQPLIAFFLQPYPISQTGPTNSDHEEYSSERQLNVGVDGLPLHLARSSSPPTSCYTPGHTIPAGYTPSGKYKSSTIVPGKTDKRAGR
ncbi:hypothetical protein [Paludibaculum fermentans]|uniref:Uncharacterized protein n=1 Tax=Paludibaculum fermentans TaxID=1473598 RepID=A0A7S7NWN0_PALFE|nr:hypothetical protein [Paludibaculum fermentans]QOY91153.1 hypothetical protein IRI77_14755 [Paludibaculum fermentans]